MSRHKKRNDIPDRWLDYLAIGKRLQGTRFIAFKVPLKQSLNFRLPSSEVFSPWELLDALNKEKQELGLIIDLTFTKRYYSPQDIPQSLRYVKIYTAGHEVPSDGTILSFKRAVHRFLQDNKDNDKLIGVHCTHGVNRTGYLISRYLIDVDGMNPERAVELFNSSRGHAIERQNYLKDLKHGPKRSNKDIKTCEQEPVRGEAVHRPGLSAPDSKPDSNNPKHPKSIRPQGSNFQLSHHGLLPQPPLRPPPLAHPCRPYPSPPPPLANPYRPSPPPPPAHPYRWAGGGVEEDGPWMRPPSVGESWSRHSPYLQSEWCPPKHLHKNIEGAAPVDLPPYSPRWTRTRPPARHNTNGYSNY